MSSKFLIKGDISGIQNFIFNVQSKSAAKTLKAKSFFIEAIGWLAEEKMKEAFPGSRCNYNGGGNFYMEINEQQWDENKFMLVKNELQNSFTHDNIMIGLSYIRCNKDKQYADWLRELNEVSGKVKLSIFNGLSNADSFFKSFADEDKKTIYKELSTKQLNFRNFTSTLARSKYFSIQRDERSFQPNATKGYLVSDNFISMFGYKLLLHNSHGSGHRRIFQHLPLWTDDLMERINQEIIAQRREKEQDEFEHPRPGMLIEFGYLADFARERTGTQKLGILKLDVDNLGSLFQKVKTEKDNKLLSEKLIWFFNEHLETMLDQEFITLDRNSVNGKEKMISEHVEVTTRKGTGWIREQKLLKSVYEISQRRSRYRKNIYVVFAGGDDCFLIGAWDAVIDFTITLQTEFQNFQKDQIRKLIPILTEPVTISASLLVVDAHFPVMKLAELADDELYKAKHTENHGGLLDASGKQMKNNVSFLGKVFTWSEFSSVVEIKNKFQQMVLKYGEGRAFLQRIMDSFENEDTYYWQERKKPFDPALLWRFLFDYRDIRHKDYFNAKFYNYFFGSPGSSPIGGIYKTYIWDVFKEGKKESPVLPVAARWADFLTRKK